MFRLFTASLAFILIHCATHKQNISDPKRDRARALLKSMGLDYNRPEDRELANSCVGEAEKPLISYSYYNYVIKYAEVYRNKFGSYPLELDSLSKLDGVDYSYMRTAWQMEYSCKDSCEAYKLNGFTQPELTSLMKDQGLFEVLSRKSEKVFEDCVNKKRGF